MDRDTGYQDEGYTTAECRQCHAMIVLRDDDEVPDGPFVCESCIRTTVNRAARTPLSNHLFETGVMLAKVGR